MEEQATYRKKLPSDLPPRFECHLNGTLYGTGDLAYMTELFTDYVQTSEMYGRTEATFVIKAAPVKNDCPHSSGPVHNGYLYCIRCNTPIKQTERGI